MSDHLERVTAFLDAWDNSDLPEAVAATADASRDGERPGMYRRKLTKADLRALVADAQQLRTLHTEFGIRADWISTRSSEGPVAETLGEAIEALEQFDAKHGDKVLSRELVERPVGKWRKVGGER